MRYAKYTYRVVKLGKEDVDKVNSCLLNEMTEAVTFSTPARMARTIRKWRRHPYETGGGPNILPPNALPTIHDYSPGIERVNKYLLGTFAHIDPTTLSIDSHPY